MSVDLEETVIIVAPPNNFKKATMLSILSIAFYALTKIFSKMLYRRNPNLDVFQLLATRSLICTMLSIAYIQKDFKKFLYDDIDKRQIKPLVLKTVTGIITNILWFYAV